MRERKTVVEGGLKNTHLPTFFFSHPVRGRVSVGSALASGGDAQAEQGREMVAPLPGSGEVAVMVTSPSVAA